MPIHYAISRRHDVLYARQTGVIDLPALRAAFIHYLNNPLYSHGRPELIDQTDVISTDVDFNEVRALLRQVNEVIPEGDIGTLTVVLSTKDSAFGTARMYQQLSEIDQGIRVFTENNEARALTHLGLPYPTVAEFLLKGDLTPMECGAP
ncbi:MAG: hypothetical protein AAFY03_06115 [Pseudomonadota bacterium]